MTGNLLISIALLWSTVLTAGIAWAGDDHDHGAPKGAAASAASPRIALHTELFELVGIVEAGEMTLYLDRYADNTPITNARIDIEADAVKASLTAQADGTYRWRAEVLQRPGDLALSFLVSAGADSDLLAGTLTIDAPAAGDAHPHAHAASWHSWTIGAGGAAIVLLVLALALRAQRRALRVTETVR